VVQLYVESLTRRHAIAPSCPRLRREGDMNGLRVAMPVVAICVVSGAMLVGEAVAQAGPPITRQMQDTQRAAQKKALKSKSSAHDQSKKEDKTLPASAPAAQ
jgi:hypothetical protein